jgi:tagatose 6-phosphate kinase
VTSPAFAARDLLAVGVNPAIDVYYFLDQLRVGDVNRVASVRAAAGGKANNLARAYRRLGGNPMTTGIAGGDTGRRILAELAAEGIEHDYVLADGASRQTVTVVAGGTTTVLLEPGPPVAEAALDALAAKVESSSATACAVVVTGSLPPGVPSAYVARLVYAARAASAPLVAVDTSGKALQLAATAGPHLIKVNVDEFERAFRCSGRDLSPVERLFDTLANGGVETLCLTDGARGALVLSATERFVVRTDTAKAVSTAGAGDAFLAGLLFALRRGDSLRDAARLASAAAAAALRTVGAGFIEPSAVEAALTRTQLLDYAVFFAEPRP